MATRTRRLSELDHWLIVLSALALLSCTVGMLPIPAEIDASLLPDVAMLLAVACFCWMLAQQGLPPHLLAVLFAFLAITTLYFFSFLFSPNLIGIRNLLGIIVSASVFFFFERMGRTSEPTRYGITILLVSALLCLLLGTLQKNTLSATASYMVMTAGILALRLSSSPIVTVSMVFPAVVLIAIAMDHRTMVAMGILGWGSFILLRFFPWNINRKLLLILSVGGIFLLFVLNLGLFGVNIRDYNSLALEYTGRNILSGRQIVWPAVVKAVTSTDWGLWFGLGAGQTFGALYESRLSAHNYYLQTFMQVGLVGLLAVVALLFLLWRATGRASRKDPLRHYMTVYMAVIIIHSSTTVFLMQVNLTIAINAWAGLGVGLGMLARGTAPSHSAKRLPNRRRRHDGPLGARAVG